MSKEYRVWLDQAKYDLEISKISLENKFFEWTSFQAQQSAEKALKALIIFKGEEVPRVHKISSLYHLCRSLDGDFREFYFDFDELDSLKFKAEYPFSNGDDFISPHDLISKDQTVECLREAGLIFNQVNEIIRAKDEEELKDQKL